MDTGYYGQTVMHPVGTLAVLVLAVLLIVLPRRYSILPFVLLACTISPAQRLVVANLDFTFLRLLIVAGWIRIALRNEATGFRPVPLDTVMVAWALATLVSFTAQQGSVGAFVNRFGLILDTLGVYLYTRVQVRNLGDFSRVVDHLMLLALPVLLFFLVEKATGRNLFHVLGGVPEVTMVRQGRLRVQGAFAHPILAGCFWAAVVPLAWVKYWLGEWKLSRALLAVLILCCMVIMTASSTPIIGLIISLFGLWMFRRRHFIMPLLWALVIGLIGLSFVMEAPVYHIISRIDLSGGSTGWHRYWLIHQALGNINEWWLMGIRSIDHWQVFANDITNQYVLVAIQGGLLTLVMFLLVIVIAFRSIPTIARISGQDSPQYKAAFGVGVAYLVHVVNFIGVSYFGQITFLVYLTLGFLGSFFQAYAMRNIEGTIVNPITEM